MKSIAIVVQDFDTSISPVLFLNGYLNNFGVFIDEIIISENASKLQLQKIKKKLGKYDVIGLSCYDILEKKLFSLFKNSKAITVIGGPGVTEKVNEFNYTVIGPGEYFLKQLLVDNNNDLPSLYIEEDNPQYQFLIPKASRNKIKKQKEVYIGIPTYKGCYWSKCCYCNYHKEVTPFSKERADLVVNSMFNIAKEIKSFAPNNLKIEFYMTHAAIGKPQLIKILDSFENHVNSGKKINFKWCSFFRSEKWVLPFIEKISRVNGELDIGFEFLCNEDILNKGYDADTSVKIALTAYKFNVGVTGNFMYGIPWATTQDRIQSLIRIARIRHTLNHGVILQTFTLKNTDLMNYPEQYGITVKSKVYTGFIKTVGHNKFIKESRQYVKALCTIFDHKCDEWYCPMDDELKLNILDKNSTYEIISKFYPKNLDEIKKEIEQVWNVEV